MLRDSTLQQLMRPSDIIDIKKLERESRKFLYLGFVIAIIFHGVTGLFISYKKSLIDFRKTWRAAREPITVDIIILPPRIRNPYETWRKIIKKRTSGSNEKYNFNPQLKMGVNMVMFSLLQKGGIVRRYVDYNIHKRKQQDTKQ